MLKDASTKVVLEGKFSDAQGELESCGSGSIDGQDHYLFRRLCHGRWDSKYEGHGLGHKRDSERTCDRLAGDLRFLNRSKRSGGCERCPRFLETLVILMNSGTNS